MCRVYTIMGISKRLGVTRIRNGSVTDANVHALMSIAEKMIARRFSITLRTVRFVWSLLGVTAYWTNLYRAHLMLYSHTYDMFHVSLWQDADKFLSKRWL